MRLLTLLLLLCAALPAQSPAVLAALQTGSYFPLDVGNRWVYREDTRVATSQYETWRVDRAETLNGLTYAVIAIEDQDSSAEYRFRADASGRVYLLTGAGDQLFLDPAMMGANTGMVQITSAGGPAATEVGTFPDTLNYRNPMGLEYETGVLARGVGVLSSLTTMLSGSSGGPTLIRTLVEANVAGIRFPAPVASIELGMESLTLDVSGGKVTNCAVPCYFVACGMAPGTDPAGTYKPCARARVALHNWPAAQSRTVRLQLVAPDGSAVFDRTVALDGAAESVVFLQAPLYSAPNAPLAAGVYQLTAKTADGAAQSAVAVTIQ